MPRNWLAVALLGLVPYIALAQSVKDTNPAAATRTKKLQAKVTVNFDDTSLKDALDELKTQIDSAGAGNLSYRLETGVSMNLKLTLTAKDKTLAEVLDEMFKKNGLGYYVVSKDKDRYDGWIIIKPGKERGYPEGQEPGKSTAGKTTSKDKPVEKMAGKTKPVTPAKPIEDVDKAEQTAAGKLKFAIELEENGKLVRARERYEEIIKLYPKTKAAQQAKDYLEKMKK